MLDVVIGGCCTPEDWVLHKDCIARAKDNTVCHRDAPHGGRGLPTLRECRDADAASQGGDGLMYTASSRLPMPKHWRWTVLPSLIRRR
jgi:hypothetical protein